MDTSVKIGDILEGEIIDINYEGGGIVKKDNFTIFLDKGLIGDIVKYRVVKVKKTYGIGKLLDIIKPSAYRVSSICNTSGECGGCPFQFFNYTKQLEWKEEKVKKDVEKIGGLDASIVKHIIGMEEPYRYRNNVQIPVGLKDGEIAIGFYESGSYNIADIDNCVIQTEISNEIVKTIKNFMKEYNLKPYDRKNRTGSIRHIGIRTNIENKAMVIIVTGSRNLPYSKELIKILTEKFKDIISIYQNINSGNGPVVYGEKFKKLYGEDKIIDCIGDFKFSISPNSFFQVNRVQTKILYDKVKEYMDLKSEDIIFDLYCGIGTISLYMARQAKKVYGVEIVEEAIKDAIENARLNNIENVEFICGSSEKILPELKEKGIKVDKIVVDPPRKGCDRQVLDTIIEMNPERIVYVSCNPSTLARDLKYLSENGYKIKEIQPVDMFPRSIHVECVIGMQRKDMK
ncbi:MAG: 23S rRNA (uracil(1939)-C(5))-methyltransferase RlmD [Sporanaerobacter sp.]|uniref:23S rRNA (uracil(1939)-C(5))-methyltransferase RlmD n=1 Tax=Sporanaerobacter sp. TaxID=2010183 RepID=UPI003A0FD890